MEKTNLSIEDYVQTLDSKHQVVIKTLVDLVHQVAPKTTHSVWSGIFWGGSEQNILGFGEMAYQTKSGETGTWFKFGIARQKNYYSLYVPAIKEGQYIAKAYHDQLGKVKAGASSISFTKLENVNLDTLAQLIKESLAED